MKRFIRNRFFFVAVFFINLVVFTIPISYSLDSAENKELTLVCDPWIPYSDITLLNKGLVVDIVDTALKNAGYHAKVEIVPWSRALKGTLDATYDANISIWYTDDRSSTLIYGIPFIENKLVFVKRKDRTGIKFKTLADLAQLTIGIIQDYAYGQEFLNSKLFTRESVTSLDLNLKKLKAKRLDLFVEDELVVKYHFKKFPEYAKIFEILPRPLEIKKLYVAASKKNSRARQIIDDYNREISKMLSSDQISIILKRHNLD